MGFMCLLTLILVIGKIFSLISLSWFICLLPAIISISLALLIVIGTVIVGVVGIILCNKD